jgi:zinc protease
VKLKPLARVRRHRLSAEGPLLLVESNHELPIVHLVVAWRTGACSESMQEAGLSRMALRLLRRTAGGRSAQEVDLLVDGLGASLGVDVGHSTTMLHGTVITRSLEPFVDLLADAIARPSFASDELELLRRETLSELIQRLDDDRGLARRAFRRAVFGSHPYGRGATGTRASIDGVTREAVLRLHREQLAIRDVVIAIAGDITEKASLLIAERIVEALSPTAAPADLVSEPEPFRGRRLVIVDKPERTQTQIFIGGLGTQAHDEDHVALMVANTAFGGTFSSRLTREVRSKRGWSYGAYSSLSSDRHRQAFALWTFPKAEDAAPCVALELKLLREWLDKGLSARELSAAKQYLVRSNAFAVDTANKRVGLAVEEALLGLPDGYHEQWPDAVSAVTLEQANAAVRNRLSADDLVVAVLGTASLVAEGIANAIDQLAEQSIVPFDA